MNGSCLFFGALRTQLRTPHSSSLRPLFRSLSRSSFPFVQHSVHVPLKHPSPIFTNSRLISLSSIFAPRKVTPTPPPSVVAHISTVEADANGHPQDIQKQIALYEALLSTKVKAGYDVVISRWERMCEFDAANPLLRSDEAFKLYLSALVNSGYEASINSAVRRRESLLAATAASTSPAANESSPDTGSTEISSTSGAALSKQPDAENVSQTTTTSSSHRIAEMVLSAQSATPIRPNANLSPDMAKLAAALNSGAGTSNEPITVTISESRGSWVPGTIRFVILTVIGAFFILVVFTVLLENSGLVKTAKEELQDVIEFLKDPASFATLGGRLPKGILLTGPPGTGKTLLARAVAGEAGVPFFHTSGADFDEMFVGVGAKRVRELFAAARKKSPAIIFIDELDAVGGKRSNRDQHYLKQTLNQLLVEMDGFLQTEGIIVIAATNFPDALDPALVRPGRFDRNIAVPLPDIRGRIQILKHHMKDVTTAPEADPMVLARGTPGFSGADLRNMVNQAAVQASKEHAKAVTLKHFEWAKDRILLGSERKSSFISDDVKKMTAYHEGGHALVALYTDGAMPLHKVTCVPRGHALGITSQLPEDDRYSVSKREYLAEIDVCMGGRAAEELIYGADQVTSGATSDIRKATRTARAMVKQMGYSDKIGPVYFGDRDTSVSPHKLDEIEAEVRSLIIAGESRVKELLKTKEEELHRLANALVEYETLDADEVRRVIKGEPIRNLVEVLQEAAEEKEPPSEAHS
ncbi:hypothetical protein QCA50_003115 [Cerrena zonata]|uniref:AAA+ ATPase domain-containing protein n=1 Tax=Cerrena zonata TaxID=2478898 RepID=A0AAW0GJJ3_9APHY